MFVAPSPVTGSQLRLKRTLSRSVCPIEPLAVQRRVHVPLGEAAPGVVFASADEKPSALSCARDAAKTALAAAAIALSVTWLPLDASAAAKMKLADPEAATAKGDTILRNALPINEESEKPIREIQKAIEDIRTKLRLPRGKFEAVMQAAQNASKVINQKEGQALLGIAGREKQMEAAKLVDEIRDDIQAIYYAAEQKLGDSIVPTEQRALDKLSQLEELMVPGWPYKKMPRYAGLPYLKGRAAVRVETTQGAFTVVADGYNAPVTAGNFVDLAKRGFYDGLPFGAFPRQSILTSGRPASGEPGFVDPATKAVRQIPLEVRVREFLTPIYGRTLDEAGLSDDQKDVVLPFGAYGAVAMTRPEGDANGASSEFMIYLYSGDYFTSRLLDGNYAVFGYVTEGRDVLPKLSNSDSIKKATVLYGAENLTST